jgi:HEAT repeat protein
VYSDGRVVAEGIGEAKLPAERIAKAKVAIKKVAGHDVVEVQADKLAMAAEIAGGLRVLWAGAIGPQGRDGETTRVLEVGDAVMVYEQSVNAVRCDGETVRLAPQAWDWNSQRMRPVQLLPDTRGLTHLPKKTATMPARGAFALPQTPWHGSVGDFVTLRVASPVDVRAVAVRGKAGKLVLSVGRERFLVDGEGWYALPRPIAADCVMLVPADGEAELADVQVESNAPKLQVPNGVAPASVQTPKAAELLAELEQTNEFERRVKLVRALGKTNDLAAAEPLEKIARGDRDEITRFEAVRALGALPGEIGEAVLRDALRDASPRVRDAAAVALAARKAPLTVPALIETLKHDKWMFVRRDSAEALGAHCGADALGALHGAIESKEEDDDVRRAALAALVRCKDPQAVRVLTTVLAADSEDRHLREEACTLLGAAGDRAAVTTIGETIRKARSQGGDWTALGVACTRALGNFVEGEKTLLELLADGAQPPLQIAAAEALGKSCTPAGKAALEKAANEKAPLLRRAVHDALDHCKNR